MGVRTLENCSVIKNAVKEGIGYPDTQNEKCEGYVNEQEEPYHKCERCKLYLGNADSDTYDREVETS